MTHQNIKAALSAIWIAAVGSAGFVADVTSFSNWLVIATCAIAPPLVVMRYWKYPDQTLSQSIQKALR